jgi:hypothetical protein
LHPVLHLLLGQQAELVMLADLLPLPLHQQHLGPQAACPAGAAVQAAGIAAALLPPRLQSQSLLQQQADSGAAGPVGRAAAAAVAGELLPRWALEEQVRGGVHASTVPAQAATHALVVPVQVRSHLPSMLLGPC